ncbi:MAG: hypothetical protein WAO52_03520 [Prolixibacteraceae bacterium]|jgi:hypothetical protein
MKKLLSISFALLIILSGMHFSIATHICEGEIASSKISVSGELASCGMENSSENFALTGNHLKKHCCDDKVSVLAVDHNFTPSFTDFNSFAQDILQVFLIPASIDFQSFTAINLNGTDTSPPKNLLVHAVSLPKICVFLI